VRKCWQCENDGLDHEEQVHQAAWGIIWQDAHMSFIQMSESPGVRVSEDHGGNQSAWVTGAECRERVPSEGEKWVEMV
jgi:hypothetical protein